MDDYQFYKSFYERELKRRYDLDSSINLPLTILGIVITANTYLAKNIFPVKSIFEISYKHILIFLFFLIVIFIILFLIKSFNNFYKGFEYRNFGNYGEVRIYQKKLELYNSNQNDDKKKIDFETKIIEKLVDFSTNHCVINDNRSYDLYIAKTAIIISIFLTIINYLFIATIKI